MRMYALVFSGLFLFGCLCSDRPTQAQPFDPAPQKLRVMTWNVEWLFDHYEGDNSSKLAREQSAPSKEYWLSRLEAVASVIAHQEPDILALQEIEGRQTLRDLADRLRSEHDLYYRYAFIEGSDTATEQDVGFLMRSGLVSYRRHEQSKTMFDSRNFYNLSKHLVGEFQWQDITSPLTIMNVHLRATEKAEDLRIRQARLARQWLEPHLQAGEDVILLGDFNSEHPAGSSAGELAEVKAKAKGPQLVDLLSKLPNPDQSTHLVLDKQFDRIFVSQSLLEDDEGLDWVFADVEVVVEPIIRGEPDGEAHWHDRLSRSTAELDVSDHFPVVATFELR